MFVCTLHLQSQNISSDNKPLGSLLFSCKVVNANNILIENAKITIFNDEDKMSIAYQDFTNKKGKYRQLLDLDEEYTIKIEYEGYVPKRIKLFTHIVLKEYRDVDFDIYLTIELVQETQIKTETELKQQYAGIIIWDETLKEFNYDAEKYKIFQETQDRVKNEAIALSEELKRKKEQEAQIEIEKLKQETEAKINEIKIQKEAEAKLEIELIRKNAQEELYKANKLQDKEVIKDATNKLEELKSQEKLIEIVKKAEEMAHIIEIKNQSQAMIDSIKSTKMDEAKADSIKLLSEAEVKVSRQYLNEAIAAKDEKQIQRLLNILKKESEDRIIQEKLKNEIEYREEIVSLFNYTKEYANNIKKEQGISAEFSAKMIEKLEKKANEEKLIVTQKRAELWNKKKPFEKIESLKPFVNEFVEKDLFSTKTYTIIKFPSKVDTLQKITYLIGNDSHFKNGTPINEKNYMMELSKINK